MNFIQTSHLGLVVPPGDCWMRAGALTRRWEEGRVFCCDTSFMHETWNGTDQDRWGADLCGAHGHMQSAPKRSCYHAP